jgi:hypothetical protein
MRAGVGAVIAAGLVVFAAGKALAALFSLVLGGFRFPMSLGFDFGLPGIAGGFLVGMALPLPLFAFTEASEDGVELGVAHISSLKDGPFGLGCRGLCEPVERFGLPSFLASDLSFSDGLVFSFGPCISNSKTLPMDGSDGPK